MEKPKIVKKEKLQEQEIDKRIEGLSSLMSHWAWPQFVEVVQYMQGGLQMEVFSKAFLMLEPLAKDKRHAAIVEALQQLTRLLDLPDWLSKKKPSRWDQVVNHVVEEKKDGR